MSRTYKVVPVTVFEVHWTEGGKSGKATSAFGSEADAQRIADGFNETASAGHPDKAKTEQ
jgi:hypothetical protein